MFLKASSPPFYEFGDRFLGAAPFASLPLQHGPPGLSKLESVLARVLQQSDPNDQINALRILEGFDELSPATIAILDPLASSASPEIALSSIAVLLKAKVSGSAQRLDTYLRTQPLDSVPMAILSIGSEPGEAGAIEDLTALEALMTSELLSIKLGAMAGVRKARSPHSARALVEGLDDPNADVRFLAVITLSEIFGKSGDYAPDMRLFGQNPDLYTTKWKTWWIEEGQGSSR